MDVISLALLAYAMTLGKGKKTADRLEYFPLNLELIKGKLVFTMEVLNPTKNKLKVDSFFGGVFVDDKKVGSIERSEPFDIAPKGRTRITFPVRLVPAEAVSLIAKIVSGKFTKKFKIAGIARALGLDNEVSKEIALNA
jgi:LEA14-like dessication related protein